MMKHVKTSEPYHYLLVPLIWNCLQSGNVKGAADLSDVGLKLWKNTLYSTPKDFSLSQDFLKLFTECFDVALQSDKSHHLIKIIWHYIQKANPLWIQVKKKNFFFDWKIFWFSFIHLNNFFLIGIFFVFIYSFEKFFFDWKIFFDFLKNFFDFHLLIL